MGQFIKYYFKIERGIIIIMDKELKLYLSKIENYLKHIDIIERTDIIEEIRSNILDMKNNESLTNEQIINRLGEPKELAKAYFS